ncbi:MAG: SDR family NAD(P)-dependent oxidoreductase [Candidatus Limnocylindria bacterium]
MLSNVIDTALELSVIGSFTRIGYAARSRLHDWRRAKTDALRGRTVLVTGPTSGLGREATVQLAALDARVILVGRTPSKLETLRDELAHRHGEDRFPIVEADLGSLASTRSAAADILASEPRLDVVIDNAGAIFPKRRVSEDGIEASMALMVVSPFTLVRALLPLLSRSPDARVIAVTSGGMYTQALDLDDMGFQRGEYSGAKAYARAKRAQVAMIREWSRRVPRNAVRFNAMHPGWADTPGLSEMLPGFHRLMGPVLRTPAEGVDTLIWLATDPHAGTDGGQLFLDRRPRPFDRLPSTRLRLDDRRRLWNAVVRLSVDRDPGGPR